MVQISENSKLKIGLLGASFDTGNLGVSAVAESSIKIILHKWPDAKVFLLGSGYEPKEHHLLISGRQVNVESIPIRFSKNIFLPYHFLLFVMYGLIVKILPGSSLKKSWVKRNLYFRELYEMDLAVDITGGDSFSDIYGMHRFMLGFLQKWLAVFLKKKLFFLPQTYGPFDRKITRILAKYILKRAQIIYSRDDESLEYVTSLLGNHNNSDKVRFAPDVAFVLDSHEPTNMDIGSLKEVKNKDSVVVGLNISGLLYNGGYTQNNMFGLKTDYSEVILKITKLLLEDKSTLILLVPHVFPPSGYEVESDQNACIDVYDKLSEKFANRIFVARGLYNQSEIKKIIGMCDFFIGARMHSCIAALSQKIPTVGMAYSKKFSGVFGSINAAENVIDLRNQTEEEILDSIRKNFVEREKTASQLRQVIPDIQKTILKTFDTVTV